MKNILAVLLFALAFNSCEEPDNPDYFVTAQINGMSWSSDKDREGAHLDYNADANAHFLRIWSNTSYPSINGIRYQMGISVNNPVSVGKYYFNNNGPEINAIGGVSGGVHGWKKNSIDDYFNGHSIDGFIQVTDLTKTDISGIFEFTAVTEKTSSNLVRDTIFVSEGKFHVPISGATGKKWDGPK